ncbi:MAG: hypothetical protein SGPRY_011734, partial [Prymnesium sp.]
MALLRENGFNALRVPLTLDAVVDTPSGGQAECQGSDGLFYTYNRAFVGMGYLQMLGKFIRLARDHGLLVMLDIHSHEAGKWPDDGNVGQEGGKRLVEGWEILASHFCDPGEYWNVFAADLKNEPHGMYWGSQPPSTVYPEHERWDTLAARIGNSMLTICPRWLVFVEGVGHCMVQVPESHDDLPHPCTSPSAAGQDVSVPTWWGENLQASLEYPVDLAIRQKLVYSPHVYGPSVYMQQYFTASSFPDNMPSIWHTQWGYIARAHAFPVVIGEWGGRYVGADKTWQDAIAKFMQDEANEIAGNFYWCVNPNSGDTGGLLKTWATKKGGGEPDHAKLLMLAGFAATVVPSALSMLQVPTKPAPRSPTSPQSHIPFLAQGAFDEVEAPTQPQNRAAAASPPVLEQ